MKNRIANIKNKNAWVLAIAVISMAVACKKTGYLGYTPGTGAPTITSVHTLTKADTVYTNDTIVAYNVAGDTTLTIRTTESTNTASDSVTTAGNLGAYYVIEGSNLGSATAVTFNGVTAYLNRAWSTDHSIIVSVPSNTPYAGPQATDSLVITTTHGIAYYKFAIIPPPPTPSTYSDFDFWSGSQISLTGVGLASVTAVGLTGSSESVTVLSQSDTTMVLQFPTTTINRGSLVFTYTSVGNTLTQTASQELVDLDNAYNLFFKGQFQNGFGDWSWTHPSSGNPATGPTHSYGETQSFELVFPEGGWQMEGFGTGSATNQPIFSAYTYYTFWMLGGVQAETVTLSANQLPYVWQQPTVAGIFTISLPPGVWSYFKIPIGAAGGQVPFLPAAAAQTSMNSAGNDYVSWFIPGPNGVNETFYVDEVAFVK
jgi:hypothetical protein